MATTKREDGEDFPAEAFAYVPDAESPSTWKLRLWDSVADKETAAQVGRAVAALGPGGFRGNRVQIPAGALGRVKARVLAAWRKTNPDAEPGDEPSVLKGWGMMREDDGEYEMPSPLDEILDAYSAAVGMGEPAKDLATAIYELVPAVAEMFGGMVSEGMGMGRRVLRDMGSEASNPIKCLMATYEAMLMMPEASDLRAKVMELIHMAEGVVYANPEPDNTEDSPQMESMDVRQPVRRFIREEGNQFCVISQETGRSFGCYVSRQDAEARLAQIESFSTNRMSKATTAELITWHEQLHLLTATEAVKTVHDLLEDELESRGLARPYTMSDAEKLALVERSAEIISKAAEHRYTLGPVYVPGIEDAHGEFTDAETLQSALWNWVRKGDRRIFLQHGDTVAGEAVEVLTWPFPVEAELGVPGQGITKYTFPSNTPFMGVIWEPWAWDLVKAGQLRGYSIGGHARRMEADLPVEATIQ